MVLGFALVEATATFAAELPTVELAIKGHRLVAEVAANDSTRMTGLMNRFSLRPDHGMLFVHREPGFYSYFMFQHEIPLDIVWIDAGRIIVEIIENAPPCRTKASECPHYGGAKVAHYVLELAGGMARKYELREGQRIEF